MNELSERKHELALRVMSYLSDQGLIQNEPDQGNWDSLDLFIEQALLAERRLAMEEALGIVGTLPIPQHPRRDDLKPSVADEHAKGFYAGTAARAGQAESALRSAAEKEDL